jgi:hypothetical protein
MNSVSWKQLTTVISDAMACPPGERQAFVREHCTDPSLVDDTLTLLEYGEANPHFVARVMHDLDTPPAR